MSITYEEALGTLEAMFGTPWTRESLDAVLRHFQGHMENTVESILHYGDGDPASHIKELKNGTNTDIIRMDEELAMQLAKEERTKPSSYVAASAPAAPNKKQGRGPVVELPADFLRVPGFSGSSGAADSFTVGGDEALARMLQDELFSQELANNPEFAHLAQGRPRTVGGRPTNHPALNDTVGEFSGGDVKRHGDDGHNLMEKVAEMGENTKRRLQLFAAQFNAKVGSLAGKSNASTVGSVGAGGTSGIAERRGLLDEDDGDDDLELAFAGAKKTR